MNKFAVIDIGSNSVRLMFVADGKVLYKRLNTTRLGEGIAIEPILKEEAIDRTAQAVATFYSQAKADGAKKTYAFATAAVRTAKNGREFVEKVSALCGLNVEILSGEEEAEIGILGALGNADGAVIDMGGASTELIVKEKGVIVYKKSVNLGVVRLKDTCGRDKDKLLKASHEASKSYGKIPKMDTATAIGGTATTLASLENGLQVYESEKITGTLISVETMQKWAEKLLNTPIKEIEAMPCMPKGRADVLAGGALLYAVLMQDLGIRFIRVSDQDNLEGYAIKKGLL